MEAALELGFLRDRVELEVNYFRNRSSNQLVNYTLPRTTGFSGILANLPAVVQNTGLEVMLTSKNLRKESGLQWTTSVNITFPQNKLLEFPNLESSTYANRYVVGKPLTITRVYESTGVDPETGLWTFRDVNGDGMITSAGDRTMRVFVGQHFFGGLSNILTYKNFSLDVFFQFVQQDGYNYWWTYGALIGKYNQQAFILDKTIWNQPGDLAQLQKPVTEYNPIAARTSQFYGTSDRGVGDASFVRLKNVSLSWQLPKKWTRDFMCRLYFQGQNLWTLTGYEGADPENQYQFLPPLRMFTLGGQFTL
jgi:hypothetical protein